MRKTVALGLLLSAGLAWLPALLAQNPYGRMVGRIIDPSGALIPGAGVQILNQETAVSSSTASNDQGLFDVPNLIPGRYKVVVELQGFKRMERGPLELRVGDILNIDLTLEIGNLTQSVQVSAEAPLLESSSANLGQVVDNRRIVDLPIAGGNPMYLTQLAPGILPTNPPTHGWLPHAVDAVSNIAAGGTRTRSSEFTLDGIPNLSQEGQLSFAPPPEMVQEFRVQTASFDASVGHFSGSHVNMVLKSGTNDLHGSLYFSHVNRSLMTRPFFTNRSIWDERTGPVTKEKTDRFWPYTLTNRYRATVSGPVWLPYLYNGRDRTFFIYGMDILDRIRPEGAFFTVPTQAQRQGDFSELLAIGKQYQIYNPFTIAPAPNGRFSRQPFANNIIPANLIDPMAKKLLNYFPLPNVVGTSDGRNNYSDPQPRRIDYHSQIARVDHAFSGRHRMFASLSWSYLLESWGNAFHNESTGMLRNRKHRGLSLDDVMTLTPNVVLNVRYGLTRFILHDRPVSLGFDLASLGFPSALVSQLDRQNTTFPEIVIDGYATLGANSGLKPITNYHTLSVITSWMRGKHGLRFGGELRTLQENNYSYGTISPRIENSATWTRGPLDNSAVAPIGQGLASFLTGRTTGGYADINSSYAEQSIYLSFFLQDDWRVGRKLTLNLGLRYEIESPTQERFDRTNRGFDYLSPNPIEAAAKANYALSPIPELPASQFRTPGGLLFSNVQGQPRGLWDTQYNHWSPRFGLAYSLATRTVLRTGYGIFYESLGADQIDVFQQGFSQRTSVVPSSDNGQSYQATLANPIPNQLLQPAGASAGLRTYVGRSPSFFEPSRKSAYVQRWSLSLQHEFAHRLLMEVGYLGTRGTRIGLAEDLNPTPARYLSKLPTRDQAVIDYLSQSVNNPFFGITEFQGSSLQNRTLNRAQLLRPYPHFAGVSTTSDGGFSWYHSLQLRVERRFSQGYTLQLSYTWSKFMEALEKLNPTDLQPHHVVSPQDRPQRLVMSGIYELPFGTGKRWLSSGWGAWNLFFGGWSVQGIFQGQSGPPIGFGNVIYTGTLAGLVLPRDQRTVDRWFNTDAGFEKDSQKQLGSNIRTFPLRLTGLRADGYNNLDLSIFKNFNIWERLKFQLRVEMQDSLNHAMFAAPNAAPTNTLFGSVNSIVGTEQRRINLAGKLMW